MYFWKRIKFFDLFSETKIGLEMNLIYIPILIKKKIWIIIFGIWDEKYCFKIENFLLKLVKLEIRFQFLLCINKKMYGPLFITCL